MRKVFQRIMWRPIRESASPCHPSHLEGMYLIHSHRRHTIDLWEKAAQTLSDDDKLQIDFSRTDWLVILKDVLHAVEVKKQKCKDKCWKYRKHNGDVVILRDVFEKMVGWVNKFKEVGDVAVQYDPAHACLPWAGIRLLLQVAVNDTQTFGAMAEGVEFVSNLITRYTIVEQLYLQNPSTAKDQLIKAITKLYAAVLKYLSKANRFYGRKSAGESSLIPCLRQVWPIDLLSRAHGVEHRTDCRGGRRKVHPGDIGEAGRRRCLRGTCGSYM